MLSNRTYAFWDFSVAVVCAGMALSNAYSGMWGFVVFFAFCFVMFIAYGVMALLGKGMYRKHVPTDEIKDDYGIK